MAPNEIQTTERSRNKASNDDEEEIDNRKLIGYKGEWYDVTNFVKKHPGGPIIEFFIGKDATYEIEINHHGSVMKNRKPVKSNKKFPGNQDAFSDEMLDLLHDLKKKGFYERSFYWFILKAFVTFGVLLVSLYITLSKPESLLYCIVGGYIMGIFWQQCAGMFHDLLHSQMTQNKKTGERLGLIFGSLCFGMSHMSWKDEHTIHHAMTNVADHDEEFVDPQTFQDIFAQNSNLFHFVKPHMRWLINIQYLTFLPACFIGRLRIVGRSYVGERRMEVIIPVIMHWIWMAALLSQIPSWQNIFFYYWFASIGEGILHLQLLVNHYPMPYYDKPHRHNQSHFRAVLESCINIENPIWMDWFHQALNFHIEHHCFPRMPRNRNREVGPMIKAICKKHGVKYDECRFWTATKRTLVGLRDASQIYKMWKME